MAGFDYSTEAELFPSRNRKSKRQPFAYRRFAQAADAIRFAIEELPDRSSLNSFFLEGGAMNSIEKSAIITGEYWLLVYRTCPNFAQ